MEPNSFQAEAWKSRISIFVGCVFDYVFGIHFPWFWHWFGNRFCDFLESGGLRGAKRWVCRKLWFTMVKQCISRVGWPTGGLKIQRVSNIIGYGFRHAFWQLFQLILAPLWVSFRWLLGSIFGVDFGIGNWMPRMEEDGPGRPGWRRRRGCIAKAKAGIQVRLTRTRLHGDLKRQLP